MADVGETRLEVQMLGGFSMTYGGAPVPFGRRGNGRALQVLQLLLLNQEQGIAKEKLIDAFYDWEIVGNRNNSLNNVIYRLRKQMAAAGLPEEEYISVKNGVCRWTASFPVEVDAVRFETCVTAARETEGEERTGLLKQAVALYRGELLPQISNEVWVTVESVRLKRLFEEAVRALGEILEEQREYRQILEVYDQAAGLYPFEEWQVAQVDCLMKMGQYDKAYQVYLDTVRLYSDELGLPPSAQMLERFHSMSGKLLREEEDFEGIRNDLREQEEAQGAYYCAYPSFADMFRLLRRIVERSGQTVFLMLCNLSYAGRGGRKAGRTGASVWEAETAAAMSEPSGGFDEASHLFQETLQRCLRRGDVFTRYSATQFLVLLVGAKQEDCGMIADRIDARFHRTSGSKDYQVRYYEKGIMEFDEDQPPISFQNAAGKWQ